jgi:hypothetical protein
LIAVMVSPLSSQSATVTWEFEAIVRGVEKPEFCCLDDLVFFEGQVLLGSLTFESDTPGIGQSGGALYVGAITAIDLEYLIYFEPQPPGPFEIQLSAVPGTNSLFVRDFRPVPSSGQSIDVLRARSDLQPTSSDPFGYYTSIRSFELSVYPSTIDVFVSDQLPLVPPDLSTLVAFDPAWDDILGPRTGLFLNSADDSYRVGAELTLLRAVPEPGSATLVAVAFIALILGLRIARPDPRAE